MSQKSQIELPGIQFDAQTLSFMLSSLTPAQFRVWVASQVTDGSSAEVAEMLGLSQGHVQRYQKVISKKSALSAGSEIKKSALSAGFEPNAVGTRACARATPSSVSKEVLAQKKELTARLDSWAQAQGYQPLSEMPNMYYQLWGLLNERFGHAGPQVLQDILDYLALSSHKTNLGCYLSYIIAIVKKWAADPAAREVTKSANRAALRLAQAWPLAQQARRSATQPPKYVETKFGRFRR